MRRPRGNCRRTGTTTRHGFLNEHERPIPSFCPLLHGVARRGDATLEPTLPQNKTAVFNLRESTAKDPRFDMQSESPEVLS